MAAAALRAPLARDTWRIAEIHYFRVPRERWDLMVLRARQSGANAVSSYIPWIHHEPVDGTVDLTGTTLAERDLVGFVEVCAAAGLVIERLLPLPAPATLTIAETRRA